MNPALTPERQARVVVVLTALLGGAWFLSGEHRVAGTMGFPLDDSWIYATFARNLATGKGYSFNPGELTGGATGPLYVFILAGLFALFHQIVWPAKLLGLACHCGASLFVCEATRQMAPSSRGAPLLAGLLVALSPPLLWGSLSGLETPVYLLTSCAGLYFYAARRWNWAVLLWALGVWLRPDGIALVVLGVIARPKISARGLAVAAAIAGTVIAPYLLFNWAVGGGPLPNSVGAKASAGGDWLSREWSMFSQWLWLWGLSLRPDRIGPHSVALLPAMTVGAALCFRRWPAVPIYVLGFPLAFGLFGPSGGQHGRYICYVIAYGAVLGSVGLLEVVQRLPARRVSLVVVMTGVLMWQLYDARLLSTVHGWNVRNINDMHRFVAEKVATGSSPADTVAVNDVGAMGYFSGRYVVDLMGLVSPRRSFTENLTFYRPRYLVIFPEWFAPYAVRDPSVDNIVFYDGDSTYKWSPAVGVGLRNNTIASRDVMVLFERLRPTERGATDVQVYWH